MTEEHIQEKIERTEKESQKFIKDASIRIKFQLYGFFKNLQFFEPFLLVIFLNWGLNLFQIGLLMTIQEVFTYVFEIPSGFLADVYGKKNELRLCFIFYMVSFLLYFFGPAFYMVVLGATFYGLGEAFRSGTHKAMEMEWLERHNLQEYKSYLYGMTRSWSLYGSALNAILAIILVFFIGDRGDRWIFLFAILPFALDFLLISTYPNYMNKKRDVGNNTIKEQFREEFDKLKIFLKGKTFQQGVLSSTINDSIFKSIKDYIQPIMRIFISALILDLALDTSKEDMWVKTFLGVIYAIFYLLSSFSSRKAFWVEQKVKSTRKTIDYLFDVFALLLLLEAVFIWVGLPIFIVLLYMIIYIIYNLRRPIVVGYIGEMAPIKQRATILSAETQLKSIFIFIFAPIFGYIADQFGIRWLFVIIAAFIFLINGFLKKMDVKAESEPEKEKFKAKQEQ